MNLMLRNELHDFIENFYWEMGRCRLPVELGCVESLMPLHSRIASSLLRSKLSSEVGNWGFLSEGN